PQRLEPIPSDLADDADRQPRAREGLPVHHVIRKPQGRADGANLVLEQVSKRLDQLEAKVGRQTTDIVLGLDAMRIDGVGTRSYDHVGIEGTLRQEIDI